MKEEDFKIIEALADTVLLSMIDFAFNEFCEKQQAKGHNCETCKFSMCKTDVECKALFLKEALDYYLSRE